MIAAAKLSQPGSASLLGEGRGRGGQAGLVQHTYNMIQRGASKFRTTSLHSGSISCKRCTTRGGRKKTHS
jgi:hypothetical protein